MPTTIESAPTAVTAMFGRSAKGPIEKPTRVTSLAEFTGRFGKLAAAYPLAYAVKQFFDEGGREALIVRIRNGTKAIKASNLIAASLRKAKRGLWALDRADTVNLIVIPPLAPGVDVPSSVWNAAIAYAASRRAFVLVDPPASWATAADARANVDGFVTRSPNAALYFPRVTTPDPVVSGASITVPPAAMVAGVIAKIDYDRGVWKAPAGTNARLVKASGLASTITTQDSESLNALGVNGIRDMPGAGRVIWGARTLDAAPENRYLSVRRLAAFIESSIDAGLEWVSLEPNTEATWQKVRNAVSQFLYPLWINGALLGTTTQQAFYVKCDAETMTEDDIANGRLICLVGIAPIRPAEFAVLRLTKKTK